MVEHVTEFSPGYVEAAARLWLEVARKRNFRLPGGPLEKLLLTRLNHLMRQEGCQGVAIFEGMDLVGYLLGIRVRGEGMRSPMGGHAALRPVDYGQLYQAASAHWLAHGAVEHSVEVPVSDHASIEAFFDLSFGKQQVHAVRSVEGMTSPGSVEVRTATSDDLPSIWSMAGIIAKHQAGAPTFQPPERGFLEQLPDSLRDTLSRAGERVFLAEVNGQAQGFSLWKPAHAGLMVPANSCEMSVVATRPAARGHGVGTALTAHGLRWAREQGYDYCVADWRSTNLLSARFWLNRGFTPTVFRLHRRLSPL